jgi:hypothetical protein
MDLILKLVGKEQDLQAICEGRGVQADEVRRWRDLFLTGGEAAVRREEEERGTLFEILRRIELDSKSSKRLALWTAIGAPVLVALLGAAVFLFERTRIESFDTFLADLEAQYTRTAKLYEHQIDAYKTGYRMLRALKVTMATEAAHLDEADLGTIRKGLSEWSQWAQEQAFFMSTEGLRLADDVFSIGMEFVQAVEHARDERSSASLGRVKSALQRWSTKQSALRDLMKEELRNPAARGEAK